MPKRCERRGCDDTLVIDNRTEVLRCAMFVYARADRLFSQSTAAESLGRGAALNVLNRARDIGWKDALTFSFFATKPAASHSFADLLLVLVVFAAQLSRPPTVSAADGCGKTSFGIWPFFLGYSNINDFIHSRLVNLYGA